MDPVVILSAIFGLLLACVLHEWAHARAAYSLGDPTGKYDGRLSLSPAVHLDPIGSLVLLVSSLGTGGAMPIGWAKPVRHDPDNFRDPFLDVALVAAAGPSINFILGVLFACAYRFGLPLPIFWAVLVKMNIGFGLFNLLPFPPLDGWKMIQAVVPRDTSRWLREFERKVGPHAAPVLLVVTFFIIGPYLISPLFAKIMGLLLGN
ncbi:MAG: site-2 protease family protein [Vulcanimicrobiota bacterium]